MGTMKRKNCFIIRYSWNVTALSCLAEHKKGTIVSITGFGRFIGAEQGEKNS